MVVSDACSDDIRTASLFTELVMLHLMTESFYPSCFVVFTLAFLEKIEIIQLMCWVKWNAIVRLLLFCWRPLVFDAFSQVASETNASRELTDRNHWKQRTYFGLLTIIFEDYLKYRITSQIVFAPRKRDKNHRNSKNLPIITDAQKYNTLISSNIREINASKRNSHTKTNR